MAQSKPIKAYLAEFIGTFALVFIGTAVATLQGPGVLSESGHGAAGWLGISFAFGFTLMVLVMVIGPVSGCHVNPAVTLPMALCGRLEKSQVLGYIISQLLGALAASAVLYALLTGLPDYVIATHGLGANGNPEKMSIGALFGWEVVLTALFLFTIFTATRSDAPANLAPFAIGGFLFVAHLVGAHLGDSSLNPARSLGPAIVQGGDALKIVWVFVAAPLVGGLIGWKLHDLIYGE
ncbi:MAG: aquaporin [Vicinamibacterales bacterium]|nr:aquaporin [Vicinamibacterales bacterium]|tara:strand:+ start:63 stop:770 length:708 start_codon:yes stop_codon:yes gene_type:complete